MTALQVASECCQAIDGATQGNEFGADPPMHVQCRRNVCRGFLRNQETAALESVLPRKDGGCERVVGSHCAKGRDTVRVALARSLKNVLELADFVPAIVCAAYVIVLDRNCARSFGRIEPNRRHRRRQIGDLHFLKAARQQRVGRSQEISHPGRLTKCTAYRE